MTLSEEQTGRFRPLQRYEQVAERLAADIRSGALAPGERLPSERELARVMEVSRASVREAIGALQVQGVVETRPGAGTFVSAPKLTQRLSATSFSADMRVRGLRPGSRTLESRRFPAGSTGPATPRCAGGRRTSGRRARLSTSTPAAPSRVSPFQSSWWPPSMTRRSSSCASTATEPTPVRGAAERAACTPS